MLPLKGTTGRYNKLPNVELAGLLFHFEIFAATNPQQGEDGFLARMTFAGQDNIGVAIRLPIGEDLEFLVQDNLTAITMNSVAPMNSSFRTIIKKSPKP